MQTNKAIVRFALAAALAGTAASAVFAANEAATQAVESSESTGLIGDAAITAKAKASLLSNKISGISVTTGKGVVKLSGTVQSDSVRSQATKIVAGLDGVKGVDYTALAIKKGHEPEGY